VRRFTRLVVLIVNVYGWILAAVSLGSLFITGAVVVVVHGVTKLNWPWLVLLAVCVFGAMACAFTVWALARMRGGVLLVVPTRYGTVYYPRTSDPGSRVIVSVNVALSNPARSAEGVRVVNAWFEKCRRGKQLVMERASAIAMVGTQMPRVPPGVSLQAQVTGEVDGLTDIDSDGRPLLVTLVLEDQFGRRYCRGVAVPRKDASGFLGSLGLP
jgi:hypothetical protein